MTERDWELYRLSIVEKMPDGPHKEAKITGIRHKLELIDHHESQIHPLPAKPQAMRVRRPGDEARGGLHETRH